MAHCIQAFVGPLDVATRIALTWPDARAVELVPGLGLVPLDEGLLHAICRDERLPAVEPFETLNQRVLEAVLGCAGDVAVGYFETEYFGGAGEQSAAVWQAGTALLAPSSRDDAVNRMLAALGVRSAESTDEFDAVGLGRFRTMDAFLD